MSGEEAKTTKEGEKDEKKTSGEGEAMEVEDKINAISKPTDEIKLQVDTLSAKYISGGNLLEGVELMLAVEKKQRQAEHEGNTMYAVDAIVQTCKAASNYKVLAEQITVICKRRSQFKKVVTRVVQTAMAWLDDLKDKENLNLILQALLAITEGKIYVEVERARLIMRQSKMKEAEGDIAESSKLLQSLQIETFGSMVKREKCEFLLEQMRLCLANLDFIRCGLVRNKITTKAIREFEDLEIKYWELSLVLFYNREKKEWLEMAKGYRRVLELYKEENKKVTCLANAVYTVILAEAAPGQKTLLHGLNQVLPSEPVGKLLEKLPEFRQLLKVFCTQELIPFQSPAFNPLAKFTLEGIKDDNQISTLTTLLKRRVLQHNIRVMAGYYTQVSVERVAQLSGATIDDMEEELSSMVTSGALWARIDRVSGIVKFFKEETSSAILNNWTRDIDKLLALVNTTCHQIHKEAMLVN